MRGVDGVVGGGGVVVGRVGWLVRWVVGGGRVVRERHANDRWRGERERERERVSDRQRQTERQRDREVSGGVWQRDWQKREREGTYM